MKLTIYQVDAFTNKLFSGNPAAICPLDQWLDDETMQNIAIENNLSETAFYIKNGDQFDLRWFTPASEVRLCGHATLATAHVIFKHTDYDQEEIEFNTLSGLLTVGKQEDGYTMDFPTDKIQNIDTPDIISNAIQFPIVASLSGQDDYLVILESQAQIEQLNPDIRAFKQLSKRGVIISAPGNEVDFVSRCFFPNHGIDEDPVTGSAHTTMTPYWTKQLNKKIMKARQLSSRGGAITCHYKGERVLLIGQAKTYMIGEIFIS